MPEGKAKAKASRLWWRTGALAGGLVVGVGLGCGIAIKRDLTAIPVGQIGFEDACGLQQYFDTLEAKRVAPPRIVSGNELQGERAGRSVHGGHSRFAFETEFQVREVKRLLNENWQRLPAGLDKANRVDLDVYWSEVYGLKRVVTEREAQLYLGHSEEPEALPYHVCLSEFLFGEPLYRERRSALNLAPLPSVLTPLDGGDGGVPAPIAAPGPAAGAATGLGGATGGGGGASGAANVSPATSAPTPAPGYAPATPVKH